MVLRYSTLAVLLFALAFQGYPVIAGMSQFVGIDNTPVSIVLRSFVVLLSALFVFRARVNIRGVREILVVALMVFWAAYLIRLMLATALDPAQLPKGAFYYWMWAIGTCFLPMLAILSTNIWQHLNYESLFKWTFSLTALGILLIVLNIARMGLVNMFVNGRLQLEALNPISMGHAAATFSLLGLHIALHPHRGVGGMRSVVFGVAILGVGSAVTFITGSRGPLIALVVAMIFALSGQPIKRVTKFFLLMGLASFPLIPYLVDFAQEFGFSSVIRIQNALNNSDSGMSGRFTAYLAAWEIFSEFPIFGDSITEPVFGFYPHNLILESLMATGVVGTIAILIAVFGGLGLAWRIQRNKHPASWVAPLYVQALVGAMFSGAVYSISGVWLTLALILTLDENSRKLAVRVAR